MYESLCFTSAPMSEPGWKQHTHSPAGTQAVLAACCLWPWLTAPVGAVLPGHAVPTLSSLLTFLGYSGSCQQAQPAENFAPCTVVASSPVGAFSQTAHSVYTSPLCLARGRGSVWSRPWSQCCMAQWVQDMAEGLAGFQVPSAPCGFPALAEGCWALLLPPQHLTLNQF